ncbi:MAG: peroxide stress protein YaaA [Solobacterium sp.]|nr:peroxide stress protein YaaA [Solobacterium sp.]
MKIILSPAKTMRRADDDFSHESLPVFLERTEILLEKMRGMDHDGLKKLWNCSEKLTKENMERLAVMDLENTLSPALFAYIGLAFQHLAANAMTEEQLAYLREHLYILSGFYGALKPFDGVTPYRLEMQAVFPDGMDLYAFWDASVHDEVMRNDQTVINLASKEYSRVISDHLRPQEHMITCVFAQEHGRKIRTKGTLAKMARGTMVWWMSENNITDPEDLKQFDAGYRYSEKDSDRDTFVFLEEGKRL